MVCGRLAFNGDGAEITELSPVCLEGRVIYAASFDPGLERPRVATATSLVPTSSSGKTPSGSSDRRLFFVGIAAGVIAAMALGHNGHAH